MASSVAKQRERCVARPRYAAQDSCRVLNPTHSAESGPTKRTEPHTHSDGGLLPEIDLPATTPTEDGICSCAVRDSPS